MKVAILGTGLIGGSIGLALQRLPEVERVTAYDRNSDAAKRAVERGAADSSAGSPAEAVRDVDVVFLATPVGALTQVAIESAPGLQKGVIVTDVGSTKTKVVVELERVIGSTGASYIGGHPMAGTEDEGIEAARAGLFEGAWWILTPTERAESSAFQRLHTLLTSLGAHVMAMDPAQHDELLAVISHLPHLTATALMTLAAERGRDHAGLLALAAGGFRDVTRVAASNPDIWIDICRENQAAITAILEQFTTRLMQLKHLIETGDEPTLRKLLLTAREDRRGLGATPTDGTLHHLWVPVPDRPGVLMEVTTLVGNLGVNIEDIRISHSEEGGRGTLRLTIAGADQAIKVISTLEAHGYEPRSTSV